MVKFERRLVSPEMAAGLLGKIDKNWRGDLPRPRHARALAQDMVDGEWNEDVPACIMLDKDGNLVDGMHRMYAVMIADRSIWMWFALDVESTEGLDRGAPRRLSDYLHRLLVVDGFDRLSATHRSILATLVRRIYMFEHGMGMMQSPTASNFSYHQYGDTYRRWAASVVRATNMAASCKPLRNLSELAFAMWCGIVTGREEETNIFVAKLRGLDLSEGEPALHLRQRLQPGSVNPPNRSTALALAIKAFEAHCSGEWPKILTFRPGAGEPMPELSGLRDLIPIRPDTSLSTTTVHQAKKSLGLTS